MDDEDYQEGEGEQTEVFDPYAIAPQDGNQFEIERFARLRARLLTPVPTPQSSNVYQYSYDLANQQLHVWFQSKTAKFPKPAVQYVYFGVPQEVVQQFGEAPSMMGFVKGSLGGYSYAKLG